MNNKNIFKYAIKVILGLPLCIKEKIREFKIIPATIPNL